MIWLASKAVRFMNADRCQHVGVFVNEHNSRRLDPTGCLYFGYIAIEQEGYWVQTVNLLRCEFAGRNRYVIFNNLSQLIVTLWETDCI